jgi:hypothetical protein
VRAIRGSPNGLAANYFWQEYGESNDQFGFCVASAGDVNRDGYSDVMVGAYAAEDGETDEGTVYAYYGLPWKFITYSQSTWGDVLLPGSAAELLHNEYYSDYASTFGVLEVGILGQAGYSMQFASSSDVLNYLPASGTPAALDRDLFGPTSTSSGVFGGEVVGLHLNVDFSDFGLTLGCVEIRFGDLELYNYAETPLLNGLTVRQIIERMDSALGGAAPVYPIDDLNQLCYYLNLAFWAGQPSTWAQEHLRLPMIKGDMNCDGAVNLFDVPLFVEALLTPGSFSGCDVMRGDMQSDGKVDGRDVQGRGCAGAASARCDGLDRPRKRVDGSRQGQRCCLRGWA